MVDTQTFEMDELRHPRRQPPRACIDLGLQSSAHDQTTRS